MSAGTGHTAVSCRSKTPSVIKVRNIATWHVHEYTHWRRVWMVWASVCMAMGAEWPTASLSWETLTSVRLKYTLLSPTRLNGSQSRENCMNWLSPNDEVVSDVYVDWHNDDHIDCDPFAYVTAFVHLNINSYRHKYIILMHGILAKTRWLPSHFGILIRCQFSVSVHSFLCKIILSIDKIFLRLAAACSFMFMQICLIEGWNMPRRTRMFLIFLYGSYSR